MLEESKTNTENIKEPLVGKKHRLQAITLLWLRKILWFGKGTAKTYNKLIAFTLAASNAAYLFYFELQPAVQLLFVLLFAVLQIMQSFSLEVYCLAHAEFEPPESWKISHSEVVEGFARRKCPPESQQFIKKVLEKSGIGEKTAIHPRSFETFSIEDTRKEFADVVYGVVEELLEKANTRAKDIDFLVINCSHFCPTPSLCAMTMSHFGMRHSCQSYNLGGQGCSANIPATDLAKKLLSHKPNSLALVISTEMLSRAVYVGNCKSMILGNALFRSGCCAILLSSKPVDVWQSSYKMCPSFRSQLTDKDALNVIYAKEDDEGISGLSIGREILDVASRAMKKNLSMLVPCILPYGELCRLFLARSALSPSKVNKQICSLFTWLGVDVGEFGIVPNLARGIDHFCIHAGGRGILDGVQKGLKLTDTQILPSREVLLKYGNISSSSIWYELGWLENHGWIRAGDTILQVALGSGFKCNTAVWLALQ